MNKYLQITKFTLKKETNFITNYIFQIFGYAIHIIVFYFVWDYILGDKILMEYTKQMLIWYVIVGEFVIYSTNRCNKQISSMVKNGDIANMLTKPINFVYYLFFENTSNFVKVFINIIAALLLGILMAGKIQISVQSLVLFIISIMLSLILAILFEIIIGLMSFFIEEVKALYLVISKLMLIVVFSPIEMFPMWAQVVLKMLPTTYAIYAPAKILVLFETNNAIELLICQIVSILICIVVLHFEYKKGVKKINANGG